MRDAVSAEWIKLRSTRSPYACLISVAAVTLLLAAAVGASAASSEAPLVRTNALVGLLGYGLIIFMAMAALSVSSEFSSGTIRVTFTVLKGRTTAIAAKALLLALISAVTAAVLTPVALVIAGGLANQSVPFDEATVRLLWRVPVVVAIAAVIAVGLATLVRRTAAVVAIVIIWPLLVEGLTTLIPRVGQQVATFLPFSNAHLFLGDPQGLPFRWAPGVGLAIFAGVAAAFAVLAAWRVNSRDA